MGQAADVIVIGAGIVGSAVASRLSRNGISTLLLDGHGPGGGATAAGMGHLVVMDDSDAQMRLTCYAMRLWDELTETLGPTAEHTRSGTLWIASDEEELAFVKKKASYYRQYNISVETLDTQDLAQCEPQLRQGLAGGLLVPTDAVVYAPVIAKQLVAEAMAQGLQARWGERVTAIDGNTITLAGGETIGADTIILATGADACQLCPDLPVRPRKGHLAITDRYPGTIRHQLIELGYLKSAHQSRDDSVAFNVQPRATGQLLIGSSRQFNSSEAAIDEAILARMVTRTLHFLPGLAAASVIRTWTGFRAATPDHLPLIGPHPQNPRLLLATGHEGLGITTSLATAALLVDPLVDHAPEIDLAPYRPSRFAEGVAP